MIKGLDVLQIIFIFIISFVAGFFIFFYNQNKDFFTELITFLSILFGFQITAFSVLFNSKSLSTLHKLQDETYGNRLEKLSRYFEFTFYIEFIIIVMLFILKRFGMVNLSIFPTLMIVCWCFYKISKILFEFFRTPRNP